jgi:hypothetical protein
MWRIFIWLIAVFGLILILIFLILPGGSKSPTKAGTSNLYDYANSSAVASMIIDGPITSDQDHRAIKVSVSNSQIVYQVIQGYNGYVLQQQTFASNTAAYSNFLHAIYHSGFTEGNKGKVSAGSEVGYCPLGDRYILSLNEGDAQIERYWSTSCGSGAPSTFKGNLGLTLDLFKNQVPNYSEISQNVNI